MSINATTYSTANVKVGGSISLSLKKGTDFSCSIVNVVASWQVDNDNVSIEYVGETDINVKVNGKKVGMSVVTCYYMETKYSSSVGGYVPTGPMQTKEWTVIVSEDGDDYSDEEMTIHFTYHNILYVLDRWSKEAMVGSGLDYEHNALSYPPIEDPYWTTPYDLGWTNIVIPSEISYGSDIYTVTSVATRAFARTTGIQTVTLPETIREIGKEAFYWCVNLEEINIPERVKAINDGTFILCRNLKSIHLHNDIEYIGASAFSDCEGLEEINIPAKCTSIGNDAFKWCRNLSTLIIEDSQLTLNLGYSYELGIDYNATFYNRTEKFRGQFADCGIDSLYLGRNITFPIKPDGKTICQPFIGDCANDFYHGSISGIISGHNNRVIKFGNSLTSIPQNLFSGALIKNEIEFPDNLEYIGDEAFSNVHFSQSSLTFPESLKSIGKNAFYDCYYLNDICLLGCESIGVSAFFNCNLHHLTLPEGLVSIGENAFRNQYANDALKELTIPQSVVSIGTSAFINNSCRKVNCLPLVPPAETNPFNGATIKVKEGCGSVYREKWGRMVMAPDDEWVTVNVKKEGTFLSRLLAQDIQRQDVLRLRLSGTINDDDLSVLQEMKSNMYELDLSGLNTDELPTGFFKNWTGIITVTLPTSIKKINDEDFSGCTNLGGVIQIPSACTVIGEKAFANTQLEGVALPDGVSIGKEAFSNCYWIKAITVPTNSIVGESAFCNSGILEAEIGAGAIIGEKAFEDGDLEDVTLADGVMAIQEQAFGSSLKKITFEGEIGSIEQQTYSNIQEVHVAGLQEWCNLPFANAGPMINGPKLYIAGEELVTLEIPNEITQLRDYAFYNCQTLRSVKLPDGMIATGKNVFAVCSNLEAITFPKTLRIVNDSAFAGCEKISAIHFPSNITSIDKGAFAGCTSLSTVSFPERLSLIGDSAFYETSLNTLDFPTSIATIGDYSFGNCPLNKVVAHWDNPFVLGEPFNGVPSDCYLYIPIGTSTKYYNAGWNVFANMTEAGILTVKVNNGGTASCYDTNISNETKDIFFKPYRTFYVDVAPKDGYFIKKVRLNGVNVTDNLEDGKLCIDEPEENMTLAVVFADENVIMGDGNGDGIVSDVDAMGTANHILKNSPTLFYDYAVDMNDDDVINITDVIMIINRYLAK